jgi:hypothetical protein
LIVIATVWLVWPGSVFAADVTYEPAAGKPGTRITVFGDICVYQLGEQLLFSDRSVPLLPDGETDTFKPVAAVDIVPIDGEQTKNGITTSRQVFVVPRIPGGNYYLYLNCLDADACCTLLEPTFSVLAAPETSTVSTVRYRTSVPWLFLSASFAIGVALMAHRLRMTRSAPH